MSGPAVGPMSMLASAAASNGDIAIFQHFVVAGGWVTWFVLIPLSFVATTLVIHFVLTIRRGALVPGALVTDLDAALRVGRVSAAAETARRDGSMLGAVMHACLGRLGEGPDAVRAALDESLDLRSARLLRRVELLNIVGNVSPMIGLFGTVIGMIRAFNRMAGMEGGLGSAANAAKLSGDISIAFVNTFWGLLIAVPALALFALFRNRVDAVAEQCGATAERLLNRLGRRTAEPTGPSAPPPSSSTTTPAASSPTMSMPTPLAPTPIAVSRPPTSSSPASVSTP